MNSVRFREEKLPISRKITHTPINEKSDLFPVKMSPQFNALASSYMSSETCFCIRSLLAIK